MRILHINNNYMGTKLHQVMIEHLKDYVPDNVVFCPINPKTSSYSTKPNSYVVVSECLTTIDRFFFYKKQKKILKNLLENIDVTTVSCSHAYTLFTDGNCAYELFEKYHIPYVVAIRSTDIEFFKYRINLRVRGRKILRNAEKVFFLSETTRNYFINSFIPQKEKNAIYKKSLIIPNGIDDFWLNNSSSEIIDKNLLDNRSINLCCVSEIIKRKNIPTVVDVAYELERRGWKVHLEIIGKKTDINEFNKFINRKYLTYFEPVPKEVLIEHYKKADIFVLMSKGETFGLVYAEAMSQGVPVIYTQGEGFDGQFDDGYVGYAVKSSDISFAANRIEEILRHYMDFSRNCISSIERFSWKKICKEYSEIYSQIVED